MTQTGRFLLFAQRQAESHPQNCQVMLRIEGDALVVTSRRISPKIVGNREAAIQHYECSIYPIGAK